MMSRDAILENLCVKDPRSPSYEDLYGGNWVGEKDIPEPRTDCFCDNCFYGRDQLAMELITILEGLDYGIRNMGKG